MKLLNNAGRALGAYQSKVFRDLAAKRVHVDEIWIDACDPAPVRRGPHK